MGSSGCGLLRRFDSTNNGLANLPLHEDWATPDFRTDRQVEINDWLRRHPGTARHLILDDGIGLDEQSPHLVLTNIDNGLSFLHMLRACQILGVDAREWAADAGIRLSPSDLLALGKFRR
ncbi:MAG: hypothetical protein JJT96_18355 [Opitutales bacterium]|nr:hypothetical protein [Opitutales bacterium]